MSAISVPRNPFAPVRRMLLIKYLLYMREVCRSVSNYFAKLFILKYKYINNDRGQDIKNKRKGRCMQKSAEEKHGICGIPKDVRHLPCSSYAAQGFGPEDGS